MEIEERATHTQMPPSKKEFEVMIPVRFITKQLKYIVTDKVLTVPGHLRRYGLSEIINYLLNHEKPIPFDFLIRGEFLRTSLLDYLEKHELTNEQLVEIEYTESILAPENSIVSEHDDWVSCVVGEMDGYILSGSYDHCTYVWNEQGKRLMKIKNGHEGPLKCIGLLKNDVDGSLKYISGSLDRTLRVTEINLKGKKSTPLFECQGHQESIECISTNPLKTMFASGSWDKTIKIWEADLTDDEKIHQEVEEDDHQDSQKKKRKTTSLSLSIKSCHKTLSGHSHTVSGLAWPADNILYSCGWDNALRTWDILTCTNTSTFMSTKSMLSLSHNPSTQLIATGHSDHTIRLWDPRAPEGALVRLTLASHRHWVSSLAWSPDQSTLLASASYDRTIQLWDLRSHQPLLTLQPHQDKVLSLSWTSSHPLISGSADKTLRLHPIITPSLSS